MYISRHLTQKLKQSTLKYPVVAVIGPRQSGKTTLVKHTFSKMDYVSLEDPDIREFAKNDPRGFLSNYEKGVIIDEAQRVPDLFSYIQGIVDNKKKSGQFILTGSQNFLLHDQISQSLAGRVSILKLLPFSLQELDMKNKNFEMIIDLNDEFLFDISYLVNDMSGYYKIGFKNKYSDYFYNIQLDLPSFGVLENSYSKINMILD